MVKFTHNNILTFTIIPKLSCDVFYITTESVILHKVAYHYYIGGNNAAGGWGDRLERMLSLLLMLLLYKIIL